MKLKADHTFACPPERFWEIFWDDAYNQALDGASAATREVTSDTTTNGVRKWTTRVTPQRELPKAVQKLIGSAKLSYDQHSVLDIAKGTLQWQVVPHVLTDKVKAAGTMTVTATPGGCRRVAEGDITVKVAFVGGQIEKAIVSDVEASYAKAAETMNTFI